MHFFSVAAFLLMLALGLPTNAGKCPKVCSCDSTKLTVACIGKNLTTVPPTIDEVRNSSVPSSRRLVLVYCTQCFILYDSSPPQETIECILLGSLSFYLHWHWVRVVWERDVKIWKDIRNRFVMYL